MNQSFDMVIVGLGAMGSSAAYHLARRGLSVLGIDRYSPPHTLGSSHGESRIIREAYFEHPNYVPIIQRAYELWNQLEEYTGRSLMLKTGGLMIGDPVGELVAGSEFSARRHRLPYDRLSPDDVRRMYPAFDIPEDMIALWDPRAGILYPEACIEAHLSAAKKHGAKFLLDETVTSWAPQGGGVEVTTSKGTYHTGQFVISAGAWTAGLIPDLNLPLTVERQVLFWFEPKANPDNFTAERCPIFICEPEPDNHFYGFPDLGTGFKVARMHHGQITDADSLVRETLPEDATPVRDFVERFIPDAAGPQLAAQVCMFTNTPDRHFLIDFHPRHPQVLIGSPCSGHGFKFSSAIGEIIADLITEGDSQHDLELFSLNRFDT